MTSATSDTLACSIVSSERSDDPHDRWGQVVLVHGFGQTGRCWGPLAESLAADHAVVSVDAPGHGGSAKHASADLWRGAELLAATIDALPHDRHRDTDRDTDRDTHGHRDRHTHVHRDGDGPSVVVGYSMGARLALHLALDDSAPLDALVLIGATAGISDPAERHERRERDERLARTLELDGLESFIDAWLQQPMFAGLEPWARFEHERRRNTAAGLAASLRNAGTGSMEPLWSRLASLQLPVLCLTGEQDPRFDAFAQELVAGIGASAQHRRIAGAGHAAHLEQPPATGAAIIGWLADPAGAGLRPR